jgi:hypothetical protein
MKRIIRLTESDLIRLVKKVVKEQTTTTTDIGSILQDMRKDPACGTTINKLRDVVVQLITGMDYKTYSQSATWGDYLELLNKANTMLSNEMTKVYPRGTTNPTFKKITELSSNLGIKIPTSTDTSGDPCIKKLQEMILNKTSQSDVLKTDTKDTSWKDGIIGLSTLKSVVDGFIDFFKSVIGTNPDTMNTPLTQSPQGTLGKDLKRGQYSGLKDVEQSVGTRQY